MKKTVGITDRVARVVIAAAGVAGAGVVGFSTGWGVVLVVVAAVMLVTGLSGYCPLYSLFGISTRGSGGVGRPRGVRHMHRPAA